MRFVVEKKLLCLLCERDQGEFGVWVSRESLCTIIVIFLFYSEILFLLPLMDVGRLSNHVNSSVICVCLFLFYFVFTIISLNL